ncbi:MAG: hypothetical protein ACK4YT_14165, partial [Sphingomonas sp.]
MAPPPPPPPPPLMLLMLTAVATVASAACRFSQVFSGHPAFCSPPLARVDALESDAVRALVLRLLRPSNVVVSVVGDFDPVQL